MGCYKAIKIKKPFIVGVKLRKNFGQHNALLCGVNLAHANYIVTIDDDLEQNPDDIEKLYNLIKTEKFDLVYAIPINIKKNLLRSFVTKVYKKISRIENKKAGDGSAFRIFSKSLRNNLLDHDGPLFF
ncbi:MAG: glycosyltransferase [Bacteroidetes bacterium]|nr:glycosyltransferase [Bacteroidota bacterium]